MPDILKMSHETENFDVCIWRMKCLIVVATIVGITCYLECGALVNEKLSVGADEIPRHRINLNTAQAAELAFLPGIGPARSEKIIDERRKGGAFTGSEQLKKRCGFSDKQITKIAGMIEFR